MFFSTPRVFRVPSVKRVIVPRAVRRKANLVPSGRSVAARGGRAVTSTVKRAAR